MMTVDQLRQRLAAEIRSLAEARTTVAAGQDVSLEDLQNRVAALCRGVEARPREEARPLVDDVQRLSASLDELAAAIWTTMRRNPAARIFPFQLGRP